MTAHPHTIVLSILLFAQVLGLITSALARLSEGSAYQASSHRLFLASLAFVGVTTMAALLLSPNYWLTSGTTLTVMVLVATCDFRRAGEAAAGRSFRSPSP
jgi:hypothetical protein